jgi:alginate O-acetyltransferase complex protein AlgI
MGWNAKYALLLLLSTAITYISGIVIQWLNDNRPEKIEAKKLYELKSIPSPTLYIFYLY